MPATTIRAAVAGCTGYIGMQCVSLLEAHPNVELTRVMGRSNAGIRHSDAVPGSRCTLVISDSLEAPDADVVFAALPHTVAAAHAREWLSSGAVLIDMSADFRLRSAAQYEHWYGIPHPAPDLCEESVYGMPEVHREDIRGADLIAVPGCYPTAALLAVAPALRAGLVASDVIVDAKSGVSGAGRSPQLGTSYAEVNESVAAYGVAGHRHKPEMLQELSVLTGEEVRLTFVPHLVPMTRGILATAYLHPLDGVPASEIEGAYRDLCDGEPFLRFSERPPATKSVTGTNEAALHVAEQDGTCVITVAIDNLLKGAAGQAVQDCNLRFGFPEDAGLRVTAPWP